MQHCCRAICGHRPAVQCKGRFLKFVAICCPLPTPHVCAELWSTNERSVLRPLEGVRAPEDGSLLQGMRSCLLPPACYHAPVMHLCKQQGSMIMNKGTFSDAGMTMKKPCMKTLQALQVMRRCHYAP